MSALDIFNLAGKRALVTGAGRGLGRALSIAMAEAGAEMILCARSQPQLEETAEAIRAAGGSATLLVADVTDVEAFHAAVQELPDLQVFLNNAGVNRPKPMFEVSVEDYDAVLDLNLRAAYFAARAAAMQMRDRGQRGSIINMSSQMGHTGAPNRTLYCASKWALEGLTKSMAIELGPLGIRVNTLCPTFVETPLTRPFLQDPAFKSHVLEKIKLGRLGQLEDLVGGAIYLASDASSLMTGSALVLDGGWTTD